MFLGCTNNAELQAALLKKIQTESDKYKIQATPTFIVNDGEKKIEGAGTYEGFAFDLDALLKAKEAAAANTKK
jgi:protein-disulfide isomerase